mmetsp:Transcript_16929/g.52748  ORF Transcript_16929/g.52748 Transcript_16929/m.52748 type:complete len:259 (+) Transcript_16929:152-928(+)
MVVVQRVVDVDVLDGRRPRRNVVAALDVGVPHVLELVPDVRDHLVLVALPGVHQRGGDEVTRSVLGHEAEPERPLRPRGVEFRELPDALELEDEQAQEPRLVDGVAEDVADVVPVVDDLQRLGAVGQHVLGAAPGARERRRRRPGDDARVPAVRQLDLVHVEVARRRVVPHELDRRVDDLVVRREAEFGGVVVQRHDVAGVAGDGERADVDRALLQLLLEIHAFLCAVSVRGGGARCRGGCVGARGCQTRRFFRRRSG